MDVDDVLQKHSGQFGRFQWCVVGVLSMSFLFDCVHVFTPVFTAGEPPHWCQTPITRFGNCTHAQQMAFAIPKVKRDGRWVFDSCRMFARNYSEVTEDDVCGAMATNKTDYITIQPCETWTYDKQSVFKHTIVTDVSTVLVFLGIGGEAVS